MQVNRAFAYQLGNIRKSPEGEGVWGLIPGNGMTPNRDRPTETTQVDVRASPNTPVTFGCCRILNPFRAITEVRQAADSDLPEKRKGQKISLLELDPLAT
jgi:hypothetical protein